MRRIITISREFGSGGKEVGKRLADALKLPFYDSKIIHMLAKETGLQESYISEISEHGSYPYAFNFGRTFMALPTLQMNQNEILIAQQKVLKKIAEKGDCIIVGRGADIVLEEYAPVKIFVYADMDAKIKRCLAKKPSEEQLTLTEMKKKIKTVDDGRRRFHDILSNRTWGEKENYDLCINTTNLAIKQLIEPLAQYIENYYQGK